MYKNMRGRPRAVLATASVAQFVVALDMAVVNVALPDIRTALGFAPLDLSWVVHIYVLTFGGFLLLGGRACDLYGPRRLLLAGLTLFGLCSLAGGLAQTPAQLVAARAGQGLGAAAAAPAALALLTTTFTEGPARVRALGVWSAVNAAGGSLGVLAGGLLTQYAGWRWVMLVNLPIVAAALTLAAATPAHTPAPAPRAPEQAPAARTRGQAPAAPPTTEPAARARLDIPGAILSTAAVGLLVLGIVRADTLGWTSPTTGATLATAAVLLAAFLVTESRSPAPLLRLGLLRSRWVAGANALVFLAAAGQFAAFYFVSLYMQQVLGMGAAATGAAFLPFSAGLVAGTLAATRITAARGPRASLVPGGLLGAAGLAWFARISPDGGFLTDVLGPSLLTSVGAGLVLAPVAAAATTGIARHEAGTAAGLVNSSRQLGGSVGVAALATLAAHRTGTATGPAALNDGYALALTATAGLFALAAVAAALLPRRGTTLPVPVPAAAPAPTEPRLEGTPT
ncbi:MFS transporter [Yinghuangia seranimata]|uniref:MFS transporter n=1 Tax=Yinghuangia seranimata TaxID=408067 RepID=UPI00248B50F4|nr:MFS transporter [Yinghuangia seranimata]MDI2127741.1 MFS transporter [Yinghuangia seranimata]